MSIVATVTKCHQIGIDTFVDRRLSKIFNGDSTISEIRDWAKSRLGEDFQGFTRIEFSELEVEGAKP